MERATEKNGERSGFMGGEREGKDEDEMSRCLVRLSRKKWGKSEKMVFSLQRGRATIAISCVLLGLRVFFSVSLNS